LHSNVAVTLDDAINQLLRSSIVGVGRVRERSSDQVADLKGDGEWGIGSDGIEIVGEVEFGGGHVVDGGDITHRDGVTRTLFDLLAVGYGLPDTEADEVVRANERVCLTSCLSLTINILNDGRIQCEASRRVTGVSLNRGCGGGRGRGRGERRGNSSWARGNAAGLGVPIPRLGVHILGVGANTARLCVTVLGVGVDAARLGVTILGVGVNAVRLGVDVLGVGVNTARLGINVLGVVFDGTGHRIDNAGAGLGVHLAAGCLGVLDIAGGRPIAQVDFTRSCGYNRERGTLDGVGGRFAGSNSLCDSDGPDTLAELSATPEWIAGVCSGRAGGIEDAQKADGQKPRRYHLRFSELIWIGE
jgi:hypothetical protein